MTSIVPNRVKAFLICAAVVAGVAASAGQPDPPLVLQPGHVAVSVDRLQPYRARWKETLVNVLHQVIDRGIWEDVMTRERLDGRDVFVRDIRITKPDGTLREHYRVVADAASFAPVRSEWENDAGQSYRYHYSLPRVSGHRVNAAGAAAVPIAGAVSRPAFDYYGGVMELFLALLPRTAGAVYTFPALLTTSGADADQSGIDWPVVHVGPVETVRGAGGTPVRATRLDAMTRYGHYKVWVTDSAPYVVRTILFIGPGGRITYDPL